MKKILISVVTALLIVGCASSGKDFSPQVANTIRNGMTREEVVAKFGSNPSSIRDQGQTFIWSFAKVGFMGGTESRAVRFSFDENGKTYGIPAGGVFGDSLKFKD